VGWGWRHQNNVCSSVVHLLFICCSSVLTEQQHENQRRTTAEKQQVGWRYDVALYEAFWKKLHQKLFICTRHFSLDEDGGKKQKVFNTKQNLTPHHQNTVSYP
jgi:hypothetical protein